MGYILFAILALISSVGNTIFNRISADKIGSVLSATIKSLMITFACFIIVISFGHLNILYSLNNQDWLWVGILGVVTIIDWLFYFLALKRSHLEAFSPFETSTILFISNLLFSIFMLNTVVSGASALNIVLFFLGLAVLLAASLFAVLNKKINPTTKISWVVFSIVSALALSFTLVIVKLKLSHIPSDVVAFHQMLIVFIVSLVMFCISKDRKEMLNVKGRTYFNFFVSAVFNAMLMVFRYKALAYENANPSIINVIVALDFVFVSIATVLFFKANNKKQLLILIMLVVTGMILNALPTIITI